jgi:hypothetical protein
LPLSSTKAEKSRLLRNDKFRQDHTVWSPTQRTLNFSKFLLTFNIMFTFNSFHTAVFIITLFIMSVKHNYTLLITPDTGCLLLTTCFGHSSTIIRSIRALIDLMMVDE